MGYRQSSELLLPPPPCSSTCVQILVVQMEARRAEESATHHDEIRRDWLPGEHPRTHPQAQEVFSLCHASWSICWSGNGEQMHGVPRPHVQQKAGVLASI
jgi:hypothetical protein